MNPSSSPLHRSAPHESAARHVDGSARYVDDLPMPPGALHGVVVQSRVARGRILRKDASAALSHPGVVAVLFAADIPGHNRIGPIVHDEPVLAEDEVFYNGQPVALVVAHDRESAEEAARKVIIEVEPLEAVLTLEGALQAERFLTTPHVIARGDLGSAFEGATLVLQGETRVGGQDHFYLETHCSLAIPEEAGCFKVFSSTQHPTEVQHAVAAVLGLGSHEVVCEVPRMGGGFGGKESQASPFACLAALGAWRTGKAVKVWLDRGEDMVITGKRHPFLGRWRAAFDAEGGIRGVDVMLFADGGWSADLSTAILDRALYHLDCACWIPALRFEGRVCRTDLPSNTAFRGFGGPQGMVVMEDILERAAHTLGMDPAELRRRNYYRPGRDRTPYGQLVADPRAERMHDALLAEANYAVRKGEIAAFNASSPYLKRGLGHMAVKFGISFTNAPLNQAGALVLVYADGTVQVNHGGTEMGQGLHTKMRAVAADIFGLDISRVRLMNTSTEKVPNTSATAASSGSDLNGQAVKEACETIRARMAERAERELGAPLRFEGGQAVGPKGTMSFAALAQACWLAQISLSATGYYRTPGIAYNRNIGQGTPFYYYAWGQALVEVEVNGLTGEHRIRRADILHDVGDSLVPSIDIGQVEGAFIQGIGWLTNEEVRYGADGRCLTRGPSTYKIPAVGDVPVDLRVRLLDEARQEGTIGGSKAVGEPPLMLAIAVIGALREAICAFGPGGPATLQAPCTPEAVLREIEDRRGSP